MPMKMIFKKSLAGGIKQLSLFFLLSVQALSAQPYKAPALTHPGSWSVVIVPDPQGYTKFLRNQAILDLMTSWIAGNHEKLNIGLVLCTGDLVEHNYINELPEENGDQLSGAQWRCVSNAFGRLDNLVPYILCTGNHDYGTGSSENRYSQFNTYFPPVRSSLNHKALVGMFPNASGVKTLENACYELQPPSGPPLLVFSLEFNPRHAAVEWARSLAAMPGYRDHRAILLTHSYMRSGVRDHIRIEKEDYAPGFSDYTVGEKLWEQLVKPSPNFGMVVCGHIIDVATHAGHVGFRTDLNSDGKKVHQMLFNAQNEGGNWKGNGGDGWIRILEFYPDGKTVKVRTFSPLFASSPSTRHLAWRTEPFDEFEFTFD